MKELKSAVAGIPAIVLGKTDAENTVRQSGG